MEERQLWGLPGSGIQRVTTLKVMGPNSQFGALVFLEREPSPLITSLVLAAGAKGEAPIPSQQTHRALSPQPRIQQALRSYQLGLKTRTKISMNMEEVQTAAKTNDLHLQGLRRCARPQESCRACHGSPLPRHQDMNSCSWEWQPTPRQP